MKQLIELLKALTDLSHALHLLGSLLRDVIPSLF
jgi:hypothetical protein